MVLSLIMRDFRPLIPSSEILNSEVDVFRQLQNVQRFLSANHHGWQEKNQISGSASNPLAVIMDRIAQNAKDPLEGIAS
ncbi:MAG TPA: hypothetical protein VLE89_07355 [Chlamydiales bacterium]|nr:hypothetical protein [Chlamydiales bacterium]